MKFSEFAKHIKKIEAASSRLVITELLADLFDRLSAEEFAHALYLLQGRVAPLYESIEFGVAEKMVVKGAVSAFNLDTSYFETELKNKGDLGLTVEHFKKKYPSFDEKEMTIEELFGYLNDLARKSGTGSQAQKINLIAHIIRQLDPLSSRYAVRIPLGTLRLGFSDVTILDAFSWMLKKDKSLRTQIEQAYHVRPDLGYIGEQIKRSGVKGLSHVKPKVFTPILMMRAERLSSGEEILAKIGTCAIEPKFDGFRLQIHVKKIPHTPLKVNEYGSETCRVKLFSRSLEDMTYMYPDVVEGIVKSFKGEDAIFEGEAIGYDPHKKAFLPFQLTSSRKRKYDIEGKTKEIPLKLFVFDLLYADGRSYVHEPFTVRRKTLSEIIHTKNNVDIDTVSIAKDEVVDNAQRINDLFEEAIGQGLEGILAKKLDGTYRAGAREWNWIKFKRSYSSKIEDTIDCLVMGYDKGKGKRTEFGIGAFLVGVYDKKKDMYLTIAKIGTGLTDDEWRTLKKQCDGYKTIHKPKTYNVEKMMEVDVWVEPKIIVEIKADEISKSPIHTAGLALRFPRLERFRDDKRADDATSFEELKKMFGHQKSSQ